jgi:hypothetical protein
MKNIPFYTNQNTCIHGLFKKGIVSPKGDCHPPKNKEAAIADTANIFAYSARKKNANLIPDYSV